VVDRAAPTTPTTMVAEMICRLSNVGFVVAYTGMLNDELMAPFSREFYTKLFGGGCSVREAFEDAVMNISSLKQRERYRLFVPDGDTFWGRANDASLTSAARATDMVSSSASSSLLESSPLTVATPGALAVMVAADTGSNGHDTDDHGAARSGASLAMTSSGLAGHAWLDGSGADAGLAEGTTLKQATRTASSSVEPSPEQTTPSSISSQTEFQKLLRECSSGEFHDVAVLSLSFERCSSRISRSLSNRDCAHLVVLWCRCLSFGCGDQHSACIVQEPGKGSGGSGDVAPSGRGVSAAAFAAVGDRWRSSRRRKIVFVFSVQFRRRTAGESWSMTRCLCINSSPSSS